MKFKIVSTLEKYRDSQGVPSCASVEEEGESAEKVLKRFVFLNEHNSNQEYLDSLIAIEIPKEKEEELSPEEIEKIRFVNRKMREAMQD